MFPRETERTPGAYDPARVLGSPSAAHADLADFLLAADPRAATTVHVVLGKFGTARDRLAVTRVDSLLLQALEGIILLEKPTD